MHIEIMIDKVQKISQVTWKPLNLKYAPSLSKNSNPHK